ncbi:MAG: MBL fold metallo-hydrolase [Vulcanibacillus sp.]
MIRYSILASGSSGNSIYIGSNGYNFLIDAGISGRRIDEELKNLDVNPSDLDGIFVTHEHDDHIKSVGVYARKYRIPIYLNNNTYRNLPSTVGKIDETLINIFNTGVTKEFGELKVESFGVSHDAIEPVGYIVREKNLKLSILTDLGYVSQKIKDKIRGSNVFLFEANHNIEMLRMSSYPWVTKQRILSDIGHLSNEAAGEALAEVITSDTQCVYLCHVSKENNLRELARITVENILDSYNISRNKLRLMDTYSHKSTELEILEIKEEILLK